MKNLVNASDLKENKFQQFETSLEQKEVEGGNRKEHVKAYFTSFY